MCRYGVRVRIQHGQARDRATTPCHIDILAAALDFIFLVCVGLVDQYTPDVSLSSLIYVISTINRNVHKLI